MMMAEFSWVRLWRRGAWILGVITVLVAGAAVAFTGSASAAAYQASNQNWSSVLTPFWLMAGIFSTGAGLILVLAVAMAWRRYRSVMRFNRQLEDAIEAISDGFVLYDADERLVICNSKYKQLHPAAAHKMIPGAYFEDIIRTAAKGGLLPSAVGMVDEWVAERLARFRDPGEPEEIQFSDGRRQLYSERRTSDGGTVGIRSDITWLKIAEDALRESEARFRDLATSASDWFWEMDENLRFFYFSDRFTEVTGVTEDQLLGKTRQETGIPNVDREAWRQHLEDLDAHRPFRDFVHPRINEAGEILWLSVN
ncbi:MAG: PAS-domain containing protein, partial [Alphaproteobacteria bacterium]|nr:PAS-domain containing protein [Alphaproteobacteria bacterium]